MAYWHSNTQQADDGNFQWHIMERATNKLACGL